MDKRFDEILKAARAMQKGHFNVEIPVEGNDEVAQLAGILNDLAVLVEHKFNEAQMISRVTEKINSGIVLEEGLNYTYESFRPMIPYDRIGVAFIEENGKMVRARWARSESTHNRIQKGYSAFLEGSSLQKIIETGKPRILNDLEQYLRDHPDSDSTHRIVEEGMLSSLTCPLIALGKPIGFMFFSSMEKETYKDVHADLFLQIAGQLSVIAEKSRLYQRVLELNDLKNKFLGIAAHDLRSPLSVLVAGLDLINDGILGDVNDKQKNYLVQMRSWCGRMVNLINDLLDVSAIESGKIELKKEAVEIKGYVDGICQFNGQLAQKKSIELVFDGPDQEITVLFDPERIRQVLNNLISNAIKYSEPKTKVTVTVKAVLGDNEVWISIEDHGHGIPEGDLKNLFEFFGKADVKPTGGESSTGLGLAICKKMVEAHGGRIWFESREARGSVFTFSLPVK